MFPFTDECRRARIAQAEWQARSIAERLRFVREFRFQLVENVDAICAAVEDDVARPPHEVTASDVLTVAASAKHLLKNAHRLLKPQRVGGTPVWLWGCRDVIHRRPWGVVGLVGTWNYPLFLTAIPILHAVTAGNAVLFKPSEQAPKSGAVLHELLIASGVPKDIVQLLPATRDAGPALAEADIDFLHFTGSDAVGRKLAARLGERLIPSALELSGVDAAFVFEDADLDMAAAGVWFSATLNRGQTCMSTRRVFVAPPLMGEFVKRLESFAQSSPTMRLQTPGQVTQMNRLAQTGFESDVKPTVVLNATTNDAICNEASFSPILAVLPLTDAVEDHNASAFGLSCAIYTKDTAAAALLAAKLRVGSVVINDVIVPTAHPGTSFGGRGASGWGLTQGDGGLLQMTVPQVVTVRSGTFRPHVAAALTNDPAAADVNAGLLRFGHARTLGQRFKGLRQMIRGAMKAKKLPKAGAA